MLGVPACKQSSVLPTRCRRHTDVAHQAGTSLSALLLVLHTAAWGTLMSPQDCPCYVLSQLTGWWQISMTHALSGRCDC